MIEVRAAPVGVDVDNGPGSAGPRHRVWVAVGCGLAALVFAGAVTVGWPTGGYPWWVDVPLHVWGMVNIVVGTVVWLRAASPRIGQLMVGVGVAYCLQALESSRNLAVFAVGFCLAYLWIAVISHLALAWPHGRLATWPVRALVALSYLAAVGSQVGRFVADQPRPPWSYDIPQPNTTWAKGSSVAAVVVGLAVAVVVVHRWITATRARRRPSGPFWAAMVFFWLLLVALSAVSFFDAPEPAQVLVQLVCLTAALLLAPAVSLTRLARALLTRYRLAAVALDRAPAELQRALSGVLGDPSLTIAYPLADGSYVDLNGRPVAVWQPAPGRAVTAVYRRGRQVGVIDHDEALGDERDVARAAVEAAGLAIEKAHLYAALRTQVTQIQATQLRLATAAFDERRRIARDLHDGAQQQLFAVLVLLDLARHHLRSTADRKDHDEPDEPGTNGTPATDGTGHAEGVIDRAHTQLRDAIQSLRELTQGIYPATLVEHGLAAAVRALADLAPIPVTVDMPADRWAPHLEITAYFVIAEALTNVYKHAAADQATVRLQKTPTAMVIHVIDDGHGSANPHGSTLRGLQDRVAAVGGTAELIREPSANTRLVARLPTETP